MQPVNCIIIDDEPLARKGLREYINDVDFLHLSGEFEHPLQASSLLSGGNVQLLFLDIQMPKISGFEMLELLDEPPAIIFTTAFDEFAIKAFEANAIDYLLKPFSKERFDKSIIRWKENPASGKIPVETISDLSAVSGKGNSNRIVVKSGHNIRIIPVDDILYIEAYDDYIKVHIKNDCFLKKQTMANTESLLSDQKFARVHRSFIVNISEITRIEPLGKETYIAVMRDETKIPLSKNGYARLKSLLGI